MAQFHVQVLSNQGSVLSPVLFSVYCDDIVNFENRYAIILYADDILIITHSVTTLQHLFYSCERELQNLDLSINMSKTHCLRIGPRYDSLCSNIVNSSGVAISWVQKIKYLGIVLTSFVNFKCSIENSKIKYFRAVNSIFGKIGRCASQETFLHLISTKCTVLKFAHS